MMFVADVPLILTFMNTGKVGDTVLVILMLLKAVLLLGIVPGLATLLISFPIEPVLRRICDADGVDTESMDTWYLEK